MRYVVGGGWWVVTCPVPLLCLVLQASLVPYLTSDDPPTKLHGESLAKRGGAAHVTHCKRWSRGSSTCSRESRDGNSQDTPVGVLWVWSKRK